TSNGNVLTSGGQNAKKNHSNSVNDLCFIAAECTGLGARAAGESRHCSDREDQGGRYQALSSYGCPELHHRSKRREADGISKYQVRARVGKAKALIVGVAERAPRGMGTLWKGMVSRKLLREHRQAILRAVDRIS